MLAKTRLIVLLAALLMLTSCNSGQSTAPRIEYEYQARDEIAFSDAAELVEAADHVFTGVVDNISFAVINDETGKAPTQECNPSHLTLVTINDVIVLENYKGAERRVMRVMTQGGIKGYREDEQLFLLIGAGVVSPDGKHRILVDHEVSPLEEGDVYLFVVLNLIVEFEGYRNFVGVINSRQALLDLDNPFEEIDNFSSITVESIISEFGESAFEGHWENWQRNNQDWEERLAQGNRRSQSILQDSQITYD